MIIEGVNFLSVVFSGLIAGYAMAFVGYWMEGFCRLPRIDLSETALIYFDEDGASRWWIGIIAHQIDSVLFSLAFAGLFYAHLPGWGGVRGLLFGVLLWLTVSLVALMGRMVGVKVFQRRIRLTLPHSIANLLLHLLYGFILGALYVPPG
jgi:hypothetical protein